MMKIVLRKQPQKYLASVDAMASQGYAHHSVGIYLSLLRQIFNYAVLVQDIAANPAEWISCLAAYSASVA